MLLAFVLRSCRNQALQGHLLVRQSGVKKAEAVGSPIRHFGQGEKTRIFGHAEVKTKEKDYKHLILAVPLGLFIIFFVDWKAVKDRFGVTFRTFITLTTMTETGDVTEFVEAEQKARSRPSNDYHYALLEKKAEMHEAMKKEALERYRADVDQLIQKDPELKALVEGKDESTIQVVNKEEFELKKKWVAEYMESLKNEK